MDGVEDEEGSASKRGWLVLRCGLYALLVLYRIRRVVRYMRCTTPQD